MMEPAGVGLSIAGRAHTLHATPVATSVPEIWLLGSSDYSARLAAEKGMPYVFAHHFSGSGTAEALELYRSTFRPSPVASAGGERSDRRPLAEPRTFLTVNAVVAESTEEAERLALPNLLMMVALRTGQPLGPQLLVEEAEKVDLPEQHRALVAAMRERWVIGSPDAARAQIEELAAAYAVDEVMVHPVAAAHVGTEPDRSPAREETLRLLAGSDD